MEGIHFRQTVEQEKGREFIPPIAKGFYALPSLASELIDPSLPIQEKEKIQQQLEHRVQRLLSGNLNGAEYKSVFDQLMWAKIEWVMSQEFRRRCKRFNLTDEDISILREMIRNNLTDAQVFILPPENFDELVRVLEEINKLNGLNRLSSIDSDGQLTTEAFFVHKTKSFPALNNHMVFKAGQDGQVRPDIVSHELGHVGFSAIKEFKKGQTDEPNLARFLPNTKLNSPSSEYVGTWIETDTRVRAMFNDLVGFLDPAKESFKMSHLLILKFKRIIGTLSYDVVDLLDHYSDEDIIELANTAPAI